MRWPELRAAGRRMVEQVREKELTFIAAGVAYYAFVSLIPLVVLGIALVSRFGSDALVTDLLAMAERQLPPTLEQQVRQALTSGTNRTLATLGGIGVFLWSAFRLVRAVDIAFDRVYDTAGETSILSRILDVLLVIVVIGAGITVAVLAGSLVAGIDIQYPHLIAPLLTVVVVTPVLIPLYYFLPDMDVSLGEVLPGSVLTAATWGVLQVVFRLYVDSSSQYALYGVLAGAVLLITWLYFGALALVLGAVVNAVLAKQSSKPT